MKKTARPTGLYPCLSRGRGRVQACGLGGGDEGGPRDGVGRHGGQVLVGDGADDGVADGGGQVRVHKQRLPPATADNDVKRRNATARPLCTLHWLFSW